MADQKRRKDGQGAKRPALKKYFFLEGKLHCKLTINRGKDLLVAWNYPDGKKVTYHYSSVIKRHQRAFSTTEVCKMVNRSKYTLELAMKAGNVKYPQFTYGLDENRRTYQYMWREEDVMDLLEYLSTVHQGRPRKDGEITNYNLPTPTEVRALMRDDQVLYVKQGDNYVPTWRAKEF